MKGKLQILLEYHTFYGKEEPTINIRDSISLFSRDKIFSLIILLTNKYVNRTIDEIRDLPIFNKLKKQKNSRIEYVFCTEMTCLEILRYTFNSPIISSNPCSLSDEQKNDLLIKIILTINEKIVRYKSLEDILNVPQVLFLFSICNPFIDLSNKNEIKNRVIYQLEMGMKFLKFISSQKAYENLYKAFLETHNIKNWKEYILSICGIILCSHYTTGEIDKQSLSDSFISENVLKSISISYNESINFSSQDKDDRNSNDDYRTFRAKPIIQKENNNYCVHNIELLTDRLYNSLYFEFKSFNQCEINKININNLFTAIFCEKIIFSTYIKQCTNKRNYKYLSETDCLNISNVPKNSPGAPDSLIFNKSKVFLFECKDIRINGSEIEKHDWHTIINEYKKKLYKKEDNGTVGITQLTSNIKRIREGNFTWNKEFNKNIIIYPVLVLSDYKNVVRGINNVVNEWYQDELNKLNHIHKNNKPIIVMSFLTLFKYHSLFKKKGFDFYIEKYLYDTRTCSDFLIQNMTFDEFMSSYPYNKIKDLQAYYTELTT